MIVDKEKKEEIITQFRLKENDSGSVEVQVALLTERINRLTEHLKLYPQDRHSRHALHGVIGKQRRFLAYLNRTDPKRYYALITRLGLRK
ncbi:MAG TPA: 30S ribosomal protein S15 [Dehalococcoidia bacterium]|nr:30S ribosomal protein S15 [Dehalococcoidia bacterium]HUW46588.1 30S ribosomal protein S15 [Dehalococcoidia bacterium]HUX47838.1 30S ribosomal protein S15 [Dehalococcoidia bacterium]